MIEQKKKMRLDELQVESFVTKFDTNKTAETNDIKGGTYVTYQESCRIVEREVIKIASKLFC